ncbi:hypothetical protein WA158_006704 [Blastocystis sp. Blastoise]
MMNTTEVEIEYDYASDIPLEYICPSCIKDIFPSLKELKIIVNTHYKRTEILLNPNSDDYIMEYNRLFNKNDYEINNPEIYDYYTESEMNEYNKISSSLDRNKLYYSKDLINTYNERREKNELPKLYKYIVNEAIYTNDYSKTEINKTKDEYALKDAVTITYDVYLVSISQYNIMIFMTLIKEGLFDSLTVFSVYGWIKGSIKGINVNLLNEIKTTHLFPNVTEIIYDDYIYDNYDYTYNYDNDSFDFQYNDDELFQLSSIKKEYFPKLHIINYNIEITTKNYESLFPINIMSVIDTIRINDIDIDQKEEIAFLLDKLVYTHSIHIDRVDTYVYHCISYFPHLNDLLAKNQIILDCLDIYSSCSENIKIFYYIESNKQNIDSLDIAFDDDHDEIDIKNSLERFLKSSVLEHLNELTVTFNYNISIHYLTWISTLFNDNKFNTIHELTINLRSIKEDSSSEALTTYKNIVEKLIPKASIITIKDCTLSFINGFIPKGCFHNTTQLILEIKDMPDDNFCKLYTTDNFPQLKHIKFYKGNSIEWWSSFMKTSCTYINNNNFPSSSIVRLGEWYDDYDDDYVYDPNASIFRCKYDTNSFMNTIIGTKDKVMSKFEIETLFDCINENKTQNIKSLDLYIYDDEQLSKLISFITIEKFPKLKELALNICYVTSQEQIDIYKQQLEYSKIIQENHVIIISLMVKEKVLFDVDKFNRLKEDINVYEDLMKDVVSVFAAVMNLGIHSGLSINRLIKHIGDDCIEKEGERNELEKKCVYECKNNEDMNVNMDFNDDDNMDLIRFTNNGPVFQISKSVLDSLKGSFIEEQRDEECRANDGSVYLDYPGNDASVYYLLDYLNGKNVYFESFSYEEQLEILNLFEFCGLVIPMELIDCRERRDRKMKKYEEGDEVSLIINGNKNDIIKEYLVKNGLWNNYVKNYDNGFINYNHIDDSLYMNKKYEYIEYITQYINNGTIDIKEDKIIAINKELFEKEMIELFGEKGREEAKEAMIGKPTVFINSKIIEKRCFETRLMNWLGKEKKWKLLFRASEHNYSAREFHRCCDNKGETVTIIKHIGHNNHINIFGGYTNQNWDSDSYMKRYSKEFLFTLSNEHNILPTKYEYINNDKDSGIYCNSSYGPTFGQPSDIEIHDNCHNNNDSYCLARDCSESSTPQKSSLFVNTDDANSKNNFIVEDYEVLSFLSEITTFYLKWNQYKQKYIQNTLSENIFSIPLLLQSPSSSSSPSPSSHIIIPKTPLPSPPSLSESIDSISEPIESFSISPSSSISSSLSILENSIPSPSIYIPSIYSPLSITDTLFLSPSTEPYIEEESNSISLSPVELSSCLYCGVYMDISRMSVSSLYPNLYICPKCFDKYIKDIHIFETYISSFYDNTNTDYIPESPPSYNELNDGNSLIPENAIGDDIYISQPNETIKNQIIDIDIDIDMIQEKSNDNSEQISNNQNIQEENSSIQISHNNDLSGYDGDNENNNILLRTFSSNGVQRMVTNHSIETAYMYEEDISNSIYKDPFNDIGINLNEYDFMD